MRVRSSGTGFTYRSPAFPGGIELEIPLPGAHQAHNAAVGLLLLEQVGRLPRADRIPGLMAEVRWPGRVETVEDGGLTWILDVAHNPAGAAALTATLADLEPRRPLVVVTAMLARKAWRAILDVLREPADSMVLTIADSHPRGTAWNLSEAGDYLDRSSGSRRAKRKQAVEPCPGLAEALERARELAAGGTVVVAGSCYLVGDVRDAIAARASSAPPAPDEIRADVAPHEEHGK